MYSECLTCTKMGAACDGPNFMAMTNHELLDWCKQRKAALKYTNAKLAELSGVPKGTIDRLLAGEHPDFKYETIRPLLKALVGGSWLGKACPAPDSEAEETIRQQAEMIKKLQEENAHLQPHIDDLRDRIKGQKKAIITLAIIAGVCLAVIITALIIDRLNYDVGFFWRAAFDTGRSGGQYFEVGI